MNDNWSLKDYINEPDTHIPSGGCWVWLSDTNTLRQKLIVELVDIAFKCYQNEEYITGEIIEVTINKCFGVDE